MKQKYSLDAEKLVFNLEKNSFRSFLKTGLNYLYTGILVTLFIWLLAYSEIIPSPKTFLLNKLNHRLLSHVDDLNVKFDSISNMLTDVQDRDDNCYRVYSQISPLPPSIRRAGFGGSNNYEYLDGYKYSDLLIESNLKSDILLKQLRLQTQSYDTVISLARTIQDSLLSSPAILPIMPNDFRGITSPFGLRIHPLTGRLQMHDGVDIAVNMKTPVHASGNGKVIKANKSFIGYGNYIVIQHGFGFETLYAHLHDINVKVGEKVVRGEVIGFSGNSGTSTGPHLHYEVHYQHIKRNPKLFYIDDLSNQEYKEMVQAYLTSK